jgi:N-acyl-D-amino-acid deacylase
MAEQYPYTAGSTMLSAVLPPWVHADGPDGTLDHLTSEDSRERIRKDIEQWRVPGWENIGVLAGWENVTVADVGSDANAEYEGENIAAIAADWEVHPVEAVCDLLVDESLQVNIVLHLLDESDVRNILVDERVCIATDGLFGGKPHPRVYGTYPRVLGTYVREENLLTIEEAIRKMTSLPARSMGLQRKGLIRPGMDADLVIFEPGEVESRATYKRPRQHPRGINHVVVNGEFVVRDGTITGSLSGDTLRKGVDG